MRLLIDAQLPQALCGWFIDRGHEAEHVRDILGGQTPDREIARHAEQHALVLVTMDDDFLLRHPPERSRLVWLRCCNLSNRALRAWLDLRWPAVEERLSQGEKVVEVR
jgi:predicted nuclease of predicted toxin-antitoxin system